MRVAALVVGSRGWLEHVGLNTWLRSSRPEKQNSTIPWDAITRIESRRIIVRDDVLGSEHPRVAPWAVCREQAVGNKVWMTDPLEDTQALSAEEVAELTGEAEEQDETGAPEKVAEAEEAVPIESFDELGGRAPQPFTPEETPPTPVDTDVAMTEPMYSTDEEGTDSGESGDFMRDQEPADRQPRPSNAAAPGQRPSDSGSTPSDIPTEADEDAHRDHTLRRQPS